MKTTKLNKASGYEVLVNFGILNSKISISCQNRDLLFNENSNSESDYVFTRLKLICKKAA
jgi:hypothetical protein